MVEWFKRHSANIVVYPKNTTSLAEAQQAVGKLFPEATSLEGYPFPAAVCQPERTFGSSDLEALAEHPVASGTDGVCKFRAADVILSGEYLLLSFKPATAESAAAFEALRSKLGESDSDEALPGLIMPFVWLPNGQMFHYQMLSGISKALATAFLEIDVDLRDLHILTPEQWMREWKNAFGPS